MMNSGVVQFFHKPPVSVSSSTTTTTTIHRKSLSTDDYYGNHQRIQGMVVIIVDDTGRGGGKQRNAYLCKIVTPSSTTLLTVPSIKEEDTLPWSTIDTNTNNEENNSKDSSVFVQYSVCVTIPLQSNGGTGIQFTKLMDDDNGNDTDTDTDTDTNETKDDNGVKELCHELETILGVRVTTKPIYHIHHIYTKRPHNTTTTTRKKSNESSLQGMEQWCVASPIHNTDSSRSSSSSSSSSSDIKGCIVHLLPNNNNNNNIITTGGIIPNPLSSLTIFPLHDNNNNNNNNDYSTNTKNTFLQLCLKRQMIGCVIVVVDPTTTTKQRRLIKRGGDRRTYSPVVQRCSTRLQTKESTTDTDSDRDDTNHHNTDQCSISLCIPDTTSSSSGGKTMKQYTFTIANARPYPNYTNVQHDEYQFVPNNSLGIILPSTRITILPPNVTTHSNDDTIHHPHCVVDQDVDTTVQCNKGTTTKEEEGIKANHIRTTSSTPPPPPTRSSDATNTLLDTIHAIRSWSTRVGGGDDTYKDRTHRAAGLGSHIVSTKQHKIISSGVDVPRSFLLSGPPGVGKTYAVQTVVRMSNIESSSSSSSLCKSSSKSSPTTPTKITHLLSIRGSELLSSGSTEADAAIALNKKFASALKFASKRNKNICILFMDECDALLSSTIVSSALAKILDQLSSSSSSSSSCFVKGEGGGRGGGDELLLFGGEVCEDANALKRIIVVAGTNRIDAIPEGLRRPGRFDRELCIGPPNREARFTILKSLIEQYETTPDRGRRTKNETTGLVVLPKIENTDGDESKDPNGNSSGSMMLRLGGKEQGGLSSIADACVGYVPADLAALVRKAAYYGIQDGSSRITIELLRQAMKDVGASALRESAISAPPLTRWDDIAGDVGGAKTALRRAIEWPQTKAKQFARLGLVPPRGILLHGPPGCGKTKLARAAAGAAKIAFISLSPADVYSSSYVGEAEAVVRRAFALARSASPCVLFFDEIDSIVSTSSSNGNDYGMGRGTTAEARVLSTFLNEMDGVDGSISDGVLLLGATNRPSTIDAALLRPGRFDRVIYVPPPDRVGRRAILESQCKVWNEQPLESIDSDMVDIDYLSSDDVSGLMTGAEIVGACRDAAMLAVKEFISLHPEAESTELVPRVLHCYLEQSLRAVKPLLSNAKILIEYTSFENKNKD